jgi:KaiC/GvpD/RAD55 family RecA-like ATPase
MNLIECANVLLSNLEGIDPSYINGIVRDIDYCVISHYRDFFEEALSFFGKNGKFPDRAYMSKKYIAIPEKEPIFSDSIKMEFDRLFKEDVLKYKTNSLLNKGDFDGIVRLISETKQVVDLQPKNIEIGGVMEEYDKMTREPSGLLTGVPEIDDLAKGCGYSTVTVIAAPPGQGKTTLAISAAYANSVLSDARGIYLTLEVSERDWWFSLLSRHSRTLKTPLSAERIKKILLTPKEREILGNVHEDIMKTMKGKIKLFTVNDFKNFSLTEMEQKFNQLEEEWGDIDYIMVDYIQLFRFYKPSHMQADEYCNNVIRFFGQYAIKSNEGRGCAVFLLSQVNREGTKRLAKTGYGDLSCLAEFNELERTAHLAVVIHSSEQHRLNGTIGVSIVKNRTGLICEELKYAYADFAHYMVGSVHFPTLFELDAKSLLSGDTIDPDVPF